jgi:hypothetical protein
VFFAHPAFRQTKLESRFGQAVAFFMKHGFYEAAKATLQNYSDEARDAQFYLLNGRVLMRTRDASNAGLTALQSFERLLQLDPENERGWAGYARALFEAGDYSLKIVAVTNKGKETSRTLKLKVNALESDPQAGSDAADRIVAAGAPVKLHGTNLSHIIMVVINDQQINATYNSADDCIEYTIPADMPDGSYRISLLDNNGVSYGADKIVIVSKPTVLSSSFGAMAGDPVTINGFYLNDVATITVGDKACTITEKTANSLTFTTPELEVGDYEVKGTTASGDPLQFCKDNDLVETALFIIAAEKIIWTGDYLVSWELPDGNPNKEWREISQEEFAKFDIGHTLTFSLKYDETATYHQYQFDNWEWASLPGQQKTDITGDTDVPVEITQDLKDAVAAKAFCIHGHGFSVTRVTYK